MQRDIRELNPHPLSIEIYGPVEITDDFLDSIAEFGILTPLLILPDGTIIGGHRRWLAAKELGLKDVPVVLSELTDPLDIEQAVIESNRQRVKTFSQKMREGEELERIAGERRGRPAILKEHKVKCANLHTITDKFNRTSDIVAEQIGIGSGRQYDKSKKIWQAAQGGDDIALAQIKRLDAKEITVHKALRTIQQGRQKCEAEDTQANVLQLAQLDGKYHTIVIDPPWPIKKILRDVRPNQDTLDYPTMTIEEIVKLPIADLADPEGCHIYLWVTHKFLPVGLYLFEQWGVKYQCLMTWVKNVGFTPFSWMYSTEHILFGRIGSLPLLKKGLRLDFRAKVAKHSEKPQEFYDLVIQASPSPRLELFARRQREGFEAWGNEVNDV